MYFCGCADRFIRPLDYRIGCNISSLPFMYPGLKLGITRVSPTLVVAPSWVLGLAPAPSLIGKFAEHPVLCRRGEFNRSFICAVKDPHDFHVSHPRRHLSPPCPPLSWLKSGWVESERDSQSVIDVPSHLFSRQPSPTVSLFSTPSRLDGRKCRENLELLSMAPCANQEQPAPSFRLEGRSESMSPSPLYPGMRRPCTAFNRAVEQLAEHFISADQEQPAPPPRLDGPHPVLLPTVVSDSKSPSPLYPGMRRPCAAFNRAMRRPRSPFPRWSRT
ncbi:hypothetical protein B0H14DRAFT_2592531 [Mycena olivaceomarginata]|nr:hypothetical protein B0H14DRAFT_2592531 [Mycena olivaceomarginata]